MRVYHFTEARWALEDIQRRRIKIAEYHNCNDPFELGCFVGRNKKDRLVLRLSKQGMQEKFGIVSFSRNWHNTVLWSQYANKHSGICLGFDLRRDLAQKVRYPKTRPYFPALPNAETGKMLLLVKPPGWSYEKEWRVSTTLKDRDPVNDFCFYDFSDDFRLREVIVGACSDVSAERVRRALGKYPYPVAVKKARLGFKRFEVVLQKQGFKKSVVPPDFAEKYPEDVLKSMQEAGYDFKKRREH